MAEINLDQDAGLRRLCTAFGFVESDQDDREPFR
jgi:hypothetical protein